MRSHSAVDLTVVINLMTAMLAELYRVKYEGKKKL
jgi:hypothetical protein